jgi:hypothetical protein
LYDNMKNELAYYGIVICLLSRLFDIAEEEGIGQAWAAELHCPAPGREKGCGSETGGVKLSTVVFIAN